MFGQREQREGLQGALTEDSSTQRLRNIAVVDSERRDTLHARLEDIESRLRVANGVVVELLSVMAGAHPNPGGDAAKQSPVVGLSPLSAEILKHTEVLVGRLHGLRMSLA